MPRSRVGRSQSQLLRIVYAPEKGLVLFSDLIDLATIPPKQNDIVMTARLHPSGRVAGRIAEDVPRPVKNGRVLAAVIHGMGAGAEWNWDVEAPIAEDGTFNLESLPEDEHLQIFALCDGWVSLPPRPSEVDAYATRSGFEFRDNHGFTGGRVMPQLHFVTSGTSELLIPMHRTGDVEITVVDWDDKPIAGAKVAFSPNQAWYNGSSTLLGTGRGTLPALRLSPDERQTRAKEAHDKLSAAYRAVTDDKGVAIVRNLPAHSGWHKIDGVDREGGQFHGFQVEHPDYILIPKEPQRIMGPGSVLETVDLVPGRTASIRARMERKDAPRSVAAVTPPPRPAPAPAAVEKPQAETKAVDSPKEESFPISVSGMAKSDDGNPVAGARIVLIAVNGDHRELAVTKSGADGRFEFKDVPLPLRPNQRGGTVEVFGTARSYGLAWHGMRHVSRDQRPANLARDDDDVSFYQGESVVMNLTFPPTARLHGRVVNEQGAPVAGARIDVAGLDYLDTEGRGFHMNYREFAGMSFVPQDLRETNSAAEGTFEFTGLPRDSVAWVQISHTNFARQSLYAAITDRKISEYRYITVSSQTVQNGKVVRTPILATRAVSTSPLKIRVAKNRQVTVTAVDRDGGPVAAVGVFATSGDGATGTSAHGMTDKVGQVRLALPPGEFKLSARPPRTSDFVVTSDTMTVNEEPDNQDHELRLQDGCVLIVKAIDADSGDPIAGISFWQELDDRPGARSGLQSSTMIVDHPVSDKNGEIRCVVKPGTRKYGVGFNVLPKPYQGLGGGGGREVKCEAGKTIRATFELRKSSAE